MKWTITEYLEWIEKGMFINTIVTSLDLSYNSLTSLPESIGNLTNLDYIDYFY